MKVKDKVKGWPYLQACRTMSTNWRNELKRVWDQLSRREGSNRRRTAAGVGTAGRQGKGRGRISPAFGLRRIEVS